MWTLKADRHCVQIQFLLLISCVTLGKPSLFSELLFPNVYIGNGNTFLLKDYTKAIPDLFSFWILPHRLKRLTFTSPPFSAARVGYMLHLWSTENNRNVHRWGFCRKTFTFLIESD